MTGGRAAPHAKQTSEALRRPLELWSGLECTFNRVGDQQFDQLAFARHYERLDDFDRIAALGVRTLRYPILWERLDGARHADSRWQWTDAALGRMRDVGIDPIVGLVHHGSGPLHTSLVSDHFADELAQFAATVAARYPWVERYTPVNEPLTTARFSALYGVWYPHLHSGAAFLRATLEQIRAVRLAMDAIRDVTPGALLVQTEDLGQTHATRALGYQADFENERRWLTFDLLTGRVGRGHALYEYARSLGVTDDEIAHAVGDGCAPDIVGINHYVTSERWLDERLERYPAHAHGGNGRHGYADVEAVRALPHGTAGPASLLRQTWERYGLPLAITEAHLGCTREQQLRWLHEVWQAAHSARHAGADVRAVTAWAALGTYDWPSLVTRLDGHYEPGLFDVRAPQPRPTALAALATGLATVGTYDHPVLATPGWWHCDGRLTYSARGEHASTSTLTAQPSVVPPRARARPLLIVGARGTLGQAFVRLCEQRGLCVRAVTRAQLDITDAEAIRELLHESDAWAVVNAAGYVRVDDAEHDAARCYDANVRGALALAQACAARGLGYVTFSSDLVFDGQAQAPYLEHDATSPLGVYGATKAEAEAAVLGVLPSALVVRSAAFFGPWDDWNFVTRSLVSIAEGVPVQAADDLVVSPTYVPDLVDATLDLLIDGASGLWHLANGGAVTWAELARLAATQAGLDPSLVCSRPHESFDFAARRPSYSALGSARATLLPPLTDAIARYVHRRPWERTSMHLHEAADEFNHESTRDSVAEAAPAV